MAVGNRLQTSGSKKVRDGLSRSVCGNTMALKTGALSRMRPTGEVEDHVRSLSEQDKPNKDS